MPIILQNTQINLEDPWDYWILRMEWLTLGTYLLMSWQSGYLRQDSFNLNIRCISIISIHQMILFLILCLWTCILVYFWSYCKSFCGYYTKDIPCEVIGIYLWNDWLWELICWWVDRVVTWVRIHSISISDVYLL